MLRLYMLNKGKGVTSQFLSINAVINIIQNTARGPWNHQQKRQFASFYFSLSFCIHYTSITRQVNILYSDRHHIQTYGQIPSIRNTVGGQEYRCSHYVCKDLL